METGGRGYAGLTQIAAGITVVALAVLLFGVTKDGGGLDWVNIVMATAGAVLALTGLYTVFHDRTGHPSH